MMGERIGAIFFALLAAGTFFIAIHPGAWPLALFGFIYVGVSITMWRGAA